MSKISGYFSVFIDGYRFTTDRLTTFIKSMISIGSLCTYVEPVNRTDYPIHIVILKTEIRSKD